jgi:predicted ATPase
VLLVVEDAHWADSTSLELFELIVERVSSLPLLAIVPGIRATLGRPTAGDAGQS